MRRIVQITEKLVDDLRQAAREEGRKASTVAGAVRCLIVEDDCNDAELSKRALEAMGCSVTLAATGDDAIGLLNQSVPEDQPNFDIVFLDLCLTGSAAQGIQVLTHIRKNFPELHVVVVSGFVDAGLMRFITEHKGPGSGYIGVITKPLHQMDVREILAKHRLPTHFEI